MKGKKTIDSSIEYFKTKMKEKYGDDVHMTLKRDNHNWEILGLVYSSPKYINFNPDEFILLEIIDVVDYYNKHLKRIKMDSKINTILND